MNRPLLLLITLALVTFSGCASTGKETTDEQVNVQENETVKQLDGLDEAGDRKVALFRKLSDDLPTLTSAEQIKPYLDWLQAKTLSDNDTFRYAMMYAFYLWKVQQRDAAGAMILHAQLRLETDFRRCKNQENSVSKYTGWHEGGDIGAKIIESHRNSYIKDRELSLKLALLLEEKQKRRKGDTWLCSSINWLEALNQYDDLEKREDSSGAGNHIGRTVVVEADESLMLEAAFLSEEVWAQNRARAIANFKEKYQ